MSKHRKLTALERQHAAEGAARADLKESMVRLIYAKVEALHRQAEVEQKIRRLAAIVAEGDRELGR